MARTTNSKNVAWTMDLRQKLEDLLKEGFTVSTIANVLHISNQSIYTELRKGITLQERENQQYLKYTAENSIKYQTEKFKEKLMYGYGDDDE